MTGDVLAKLLETCGTNGLRDIRDRAILMVAFASGGRRRSEIVGLRREQLTVEPPSPSRAALPFPLAIHLVRAKTSGSELDEVVYLTARPLDALNAWLAVERIESVSILARSIAGATSRSGRWSQVRPTR